MQWKLIFFNAKSRKCRQKVYLFITKFDLFHCKNMNVFLILFALLLLFQKFQLSLQFLVQKTVIMILCLNFSHFCRVISPFPMQISIGNLISWLWDIRSINFCRFCTMSILDIMLQIQTHKPFVAISLRLESDLS